MYRLKAWLSPLHRLVLPPRSFAADAHGCIMVVGPRDPTEYKVVAREFRAPVEWELHSDYRSRCNARPLAGGLEVPRVKARAYALTRARFAAAALTRLRSQSSGSA